MTFHNIDDFGLNALELEDKYEKKGSHPEYDKGKWRQAVCDGSTELGYWAFVHYQLIDEEEQLDRCNPYSQPWADE